MKNNINAIGLGLIPLSFLPEKIGILLWSGLSGLADAIIEVLIALCYTEATKEEQVLLIKPDRAE
ncbi:MULTISPECIES: hypothetical protein [unclassified Pedobacter]|uniref:hypothetical protein n=1 Tax=unclassified Pedobacter TaxID=2628915 RepID=UPI00141DA266|nr:MULTISPECIES: hypothetical protein [unclassified Pedobacter]NII82417.1 hypothetical protein [Pedobacter sp. SG908]NMN36443.1 hypothetical protein [Pedobacter sp. SG918]